MIARFLDQYGSLLLMGIAAAALGAYILILNGRIDTVTAERDLARTQVTALTNNIENQNGAIEAWKAAADSNREVYLAGLEAAGRKAVRLEIQADDILAMPSPLTTEEQCEAAHQLLLQGVTE